MISRRSFLKCGLAGGLVLNVAACSRPSAQVGRGEILAAIIPAMLAGALPEEGAARTSAVGQTVGGVNKAISGLAPAVQKEIGELFDLLAFAPTRILVAGVRATWAEADPATIGRFLERWRLSRFALLNSGYAALHDLIFGAWYARPDHWAAIGYPGPITVQ